MDSILTEEYILSLRDPFQEPEAATKSTVQKKADLESYPVRAMVLNGVISGLKNSKAMITLPNSKTMFIKVGDKIGLRDGRVVAINGDGVRVIEYDKDRKGKTVTEYVNITIANNSNEEDSNRRSQ